MNANNNNHNNTRSRTYDKVPAGTRNIAKVLRRMAVNNGDVVVLKAGTPDATRQMVDQIRDGLQVIQKDRVLIVVLDELDNITTLDQKEMAKYGWFTLPFKNKLFPKAPEGDKLEDAPEKTE